MGFFKHKMYMWPKPGIDFHICKVQNYFIWVLEPGLQRALHIKPVIFVHFILMSEHHHSPFIYPSWLSEIFYRDVCGEYASWA